MAVARRRGVVGEEGFRCFKNIAHSGFIDSGELKMNTRFASCAAALAGFLLLAVSGVSQAGLVGHIGNCYGADAAVVIGRSGHTPVRLTTLDAASLAPLDGLMLAGCSFTANAAVNNAVAAGMVLMVHDENISGAGAKLPAAPAITLTRISGTAVDFPLGSPVLNGPGGMLTNASLDNGNASTHGYVAAGSLPAGSAIWATTADTAQVITFAYPHGLGRVVYSTVPLYCYLTNGNCASLAVAAGMQSYAANMILAATPLFISCADEGFTGSKLTLCRQVCEIDQTPAKLTSLIKLYMTVYRSKPPCAN